MNPGIVLFVIAGTAIGFFALGTVVGTDNATAERKMKEQATAAFHQFASDFGRLADSLKGGR